MKEFDVEDFPPFGTTADFALLLEKALEIPAELWMKFQSQYQIDRARGKEKNIQKIKRIETRRAKQEIG